MSETQPVLLLTGRYEPIIRKYLLEMTETLHLSEHEFCVWHLAPDQVDILFKSLPSAVNPARGANKV